MYVYVYISTWNGWIGIWIHKQTNTIRTQTHARCKLMAAKSLDYYYAELFRFRLMLVAMLSISRPVSSSSYMPNSIQLVSKNNTLANIRNALRNLVLAKSNDLISHCIHSLRLKVVSVFTFFWQRVCVCVLFFLLHGCCTLSNKTPTNKKESVGLNVSISLFRWKVKSKIEPLKMKQRTKMWKVKRSDPIQKTRCNGLNSDLLIEFVATLNNGILQQTETLFLFLSRLSLFFSNINVGGGNCQNYDRTRSLPLIKMFSFAPVCHYLLPFGLFSCWWLYHWLCICLKIMTFDWHCILCAWQKRRSFSNAARLQKRQTNDHIIQIWPYNSLNIQTDLQVCRGSTAIFCANGISIVVIFKRAFQQIDFIACSLLLCIVGHYIYLIVNVHMWMCGYIETFSIVIYSTKLSWNYLLKQLQPFKLLYVV